MLSINDLFWWFKNPYQKDTWQKMFRWKFLKALRIFVLFFFFFFEKRCLTGFWIYFWCSQQYLNDLPENLNLWIVEYLSLSLCEKCPYSNFFLVRIIPNAAEYRLEKFRIRTLSTQYFLILVPISLKSMPKLNDWWQINNQFIFS